MGYDPDKLILPNEVGWADLPCPTEEQEQAYVIQWKEIMINRYPELRRLIHIPNGGLRSKTEAVRLKRIGVKPGVSDLFFASPRGEYAGLWIEMKRQRDSRLSPAQKEWLEDMKAAGYMAERADGAEEAIAILERYLKLRERSSTERNDGD